MTLIYDNQGFIEGCRELNVDEPLAVLDGIFSRMTAIESFSIGEFYDIFDVNDRHEREKDHLFRRFKEIFGDPPM